MKSFKMNAALAAALILAGIVPAVAQSSTPGQPMVPLGYCQLTLTSAAQALSACAGGIPAGATMAWISVETANARYRDDGVAPTANAGFPILDTSAPFLYVGTTSKLQFIAESGSPVLDVLFYRQ